MTKEHICSIDVKEVNFNSVNGYWEIEMVRENEDNIYHYTAFADGMYDQLLNSGDLEL